MYWGRLYGKSTEEFKDGVKAGILAYAWWKDGIQYVGTTGETLEQALQEVDEEL